MATRSRKQPVPRSESFIFELGEFQSSYMLGVNPRQDEDEPWWEHFSVLINATCILLKKVAGRIARFDIVADRKMFVPNAGAREPNWRPLGVGLLELPPSGGRFYVSVPHDTMLAFLTAVSSGHFGYAVLSGEPLARGRSLCRSLHFERSIDLTDY